MRVRSCPRERPLPGLAIPPGAHLAEELDVRGIGVSELTRWMGQPVGVVAGILRGAVRITAGIARELDAVLGVGAAFWRRLEEHYRVNRGERVRRRFFVLADRLRRSTDPNDRAAIKRKLARLTFDE